RRRLPCRKARRITPAEVPGIALKTVVAPVRRCYLHFSKPKFNFQVYFDYFIQTKCKFEDLFLVILLQDSPLFFPYGKEIRFFF
ncbi:MAG: hypothetical protein KIC46_09190, partial [Clostridiales bacterium]|nr:hypothetical protein [Clostridiales bacterium]